MNEKERLRKAIFEMVKRKRSTLAQACVQKAGDAGLIHQSRGQRSNRKHPHQETIIARYQARYEVID